MALPQLHPHPCWSHQVFLNSTQTRLKIGAFKIVPSESANSWHFANKKGLTGPWKIRYRIHGTPGLVYLTIKNHKNTSIHVEANIPSAMDHMGKSEANKTFENFSLKLKSFDTFAGVERNFNFSRASQPNDPNG